VVATYLRVAWRTVTDIVTRVVDDRAGQSDRLEGLRRIGIDEIAHRKGQRYITVVICHETGRIVWAHEGRNQETMRLFFDELGKSRSWKLTHVSADGAEWIHTVVAERAMNARICLDPFHVAQWATEAVDEVRRQLASDLRAEGRTEEAKSLKNSRWALLHNNYALNVDQRARLATIAATNNGLYRAYLLKEQLLGVIHLKGYAASHIILKKWLSWAKRCRIEPFVKLARTIENYKPYLENTLNSGLSNARSEATNTHLRVLTRRSYGFHSAEALIAMAMLTRGGLCPDLPGRAA
jgi:transposase